MIWVCRSCVWACPGVEIWESRLGTRYLCKGCGASGRMADQDAPIQVTEEQADQYSQELQNDPTFIPPTKGGPHE